VFILKDCESGMEVRGLEMSIEKMKVLYILAYKSLPHISRRPKKRVPMSSKIVDPHLSRR